MKVQFPWPGGVRSVMAISVNFDAESYDLLSTTSERLYGRFSYGRYGVRAGLPRLLDMFERQQVSATFFVTGDDAQRHADLLKKITACGHEVACRGVTMKRPERSDELAWLKQARDMVEQAAGQSVVGFRSPDGELSPETLDHLLAAGFLYDASFQDDDAPYKFALTQGVLAEIPSCYALADAPAYSARHTHQRVLQIWRDEAHALMEAEALMPLTIHLRGDFGSTRAARIAILDTYLNEVKQASGVGFARHDELARWTLALDMPAEPDPYAIHAETLSRTVYRGDLAVKPI